ncbi:MAG TPA: PKD domain-containing protein, partial [Flavisolibacter sp.]
ISNQLPNLYSFSWNFGNGLISNGTQPFDSAMYTSSGNYDVQLIATDAYGCSDTIMKPSYIRINGPIAGFEALNPRGCKGMTVTFTDTSQTDGLNPVTTRTWDFGDGTSQTVSGPSVQHAYQDTGTFSVRLIVTDAAGCTDSILMQDLVRITQLKVKFISDSLSCPGSTVRFYNHTQGDMQQATWTFGDASAPSNDIHPIHSYTAPGLYTVKLAVSDANGCTDSSVKTNYIHVDNPVAKFTMSDSFALCTPFHVVFSNTSDFYIASYWDMDVPGGTSTVTSPQHYFTDPGVYQVQLTVLAPGGCLDSTVRTVTVYDISNFDFSYTPLGGCKPLNVDLTTNMPGPVRYLWDLSDGNMYDTTAGAISHVYDFYGTFVPKLMLTDATGCIVPFEGNDTIRIIGADALFGADQQLFCDAGTVSFTDSTTYNDSLVQYSWTFGDGNTSQAANPTHTYASPGLYTVALAVRTENNCTDTFEVQQMIKVVASPDIAIGGDDEICVRESIAHTGEFLATDTSQVQWQWVLADGSQSPLQDAPTFQYTKAGTYQVQLVAVNSTGCTDTAWRTITVHDLPFATMPGAITIQSGFPQQLPVTYSPGTLSFNWSPSTGLNCTECPQPVAGPRFNTLYTVSFADSNGCTNSARIQVITLCKNANVFLPNTFTPNGDGTNDIFYVRGKGLERVKSLRVFNRWGEIIFEQNNLPVNDPSYGWNGNAGGRPASPDVYVYQAEVFCENNQVIRLEGNVALIR